MNTKKKEKEAVKDYLMSSLLVKDNPSISVLCKDDHYDYEGFLHNKIQLFTSKVKIVKPDLGFFLNENQVLFFMIKFNLKTILILLPRQWLTQ